MDLSLLRRPPTLVGPLVRLEPAGPHHVEGLRALYVGEDTGPFADALLAQVRAALTAARGQADRVDWAIVRVADAAVVGEAVLFELEPSAETMSYRIALVGPEVFDRGYGSETTRLVRDFALGPLGLSRLGLHVSASNARAIRVYERAGFRHDGPRRVGDATDRDGELDMSAVPG